MFHTYLCMGRACVKKTIMGVGSLLPLCGSKDKIQVVKCWGEHIYLMSHLVSPPTLCIKCFKMQIYLWHLKHSNKPQQQQNSSLHPRLVSNYLFSQKWPWPSCLGLQCWDSRHAALFTVCVVQGNDHCTNPSLSWPSKDFLRLKFNV